MAENNRSRKSSAPANVRRSVSPHMPPDFLPNERECVSREQFWVNLPRRVRDDIHEKHKLALAKDAQLSAQTKVVSRLTARCSSLEALAEAIWGSRYKGVAQGDVALAIETLRLAHTLTLERLEETWAQRRNDAGVELQQPTIYHLDRDVLERILALVLGPRTPAFTGDDTCPSHYELKNDHHWRAQRMLSRVCRYWEALTLTLRSSAAHVTASAALRLPPAAAPPLGFALRDFQRSALSHRLTTLELYVPRKPWSNEIDHATIAAVLPACAALTTVYIYVQANAKAGGTTQASVPEAITKALPRCRSLRELKLVAYDRGNKSAQVKLPPGTAARVVGAIAAMTRLSALHFVGVDWTASNQLLQTLKQHAALRDMRLSGVVTTGSCLDLLDSQHLTRLELDSCTSWCYGQVQGGGQLRVFTLHQGDAVDGADDATPPVSHHQELLVLAQALPQMTGLTALALVVPDAFAEFTAALASALCGMPSLETLVLHPIGTGQCAVDACLFQALGHCSVSTLNVSLPATSDQTWVGDFAGALANARSVNTLIVYMNACSNNVEKIAPFFEGLTAIAFLRALRLVGPLRLGSACAVGMALPRCAMLSQLCLQGAALGAEDEKVLRYMVSYAPHVSLALV